MSHALRIGEARELARGMTRERLLEWAVDDVARLLKALGAHDRDLAHAALHQLNGSKLLDATAKSLVACGVSHETASTVIEWRRRAIGDVEIPVELDVADATVGAALQVPYQTASRGVVTRVSVRVAYHRASRGV